MRSFDVLRAIIFLLLFFCAAVVESCSGSSGSSSVSAVPHNSDATSTTTSTNVRWAQSMLGKKVLVTGGSEGIGRAIVEECCSLGAEVLTCGRSQEKLESAKREWDAKGYTTHTCVADLSAEEGVETLALESRAVFGESLNCLINNVGTNIRKASIDYSDDEFEKIMSTNLRSCFKLCVRLHPMLKAGGSSSICNIGSVSGGSSIIRSGVVYAMSKAAMNQLTKYLAVEWAADGIRVNGVCPWYINTPLASPVLQDAHKLSSLLERTPMGRIGEANEVSGLVAFLCTDLAAFITGQLIFVDGGFTRNGWWYQPPTI